MDGEQIEGLKLINEVTQLHTKALSELSVIVKDFQNRLNKIELGIKTKEERHAIHGSEG